MKLKEKLQEAFDKIKKINDEYQLNIRDEDVKYLVMRLQAEDDWLMKLQGAVCSSDIVSEYIRNTLALIQPNDIHKVLNSLEISVDDCGNIRSVADVLADLSTKWKNNKIDELYIEEDDKT